MQPRSPADRTERVLHVSIHANDTSQVGLRQELARLGDYRCLPWYQGNAVSAIGSHKVRVDLLRACYEHRPTLVFLQLQCGEIDGQIIAMAKALCGPQAFFFEWTGDAPVGPGGELPPWMLDHARAVDLFAASNCTYLEKLAEAGAPCALGWMVCGADETECHPVPGVPEGEWPSAGKAVLVANNHQILHHQGKRERLARYVTRELGPEGLWCYGVGWDKVEGLSWRPYVTREQRARVYATAAMAVGHDLHPGLRRYTSGRTADTLACGACYAVNAFDDWDGYGIRDGENALVWRDGKDLAGLLRDWLHPERAKDRNRVAAAGLAFAREELTWRRAFEQMLWMVREERQRRGAQP